MAGGGEAGTEGGAGAVVDPTDAAVGVAVAGIALAAGEGRRLRPLSLIRPKPMCPVGGVPLVDLALARLACVTRSRAVNVHHGRALLEAHLHNRVHLSFEDERPLGTAGAVGHLREWIAGRPTLVVNADTWCPAPLGPLLDGWDGERTRLLVVRPPAHGVGTRPQLAGALLPWSVVIDLPDEPSGLWEVSWKAAEAEGRLEVVAAAGPFVDCGTPASYLAANLAGSGGASVVGEGAVVGGTIERCVVWPGGIVRAGERLVDAIRVGELTTIYVR